MTSAAHAPTQPPRPEFGPGAAASRPAPAAPADGAPPPGADRWTRGATRALVACLAAFALLALVLAATRSPQSDEGHFASAGASLAFRGRLAMPMWTEWIPTLDRKLYSNMPLYFVLLGGWFRAFGDGWLAMRSLSVLWGGVLVVSGVGILWGITRDRRVTLLGAVLLAFTYDLVNFASARYDIMVAALGAAACAAYLLLRDRSLSRALLAANTCLAAAALTHPYAIFGLTTLGVLVLALDARQLRARHVLLSLVPYVVGFGLWGLYVMQDPAMFRAQFGENASGRLRDAASPVAALIAEVRDRYIERFAGWRPGAPPAMRAKIAFLALYAVGVAGVFALPELRRRRPALALGVATVLCALLLALVDATRWYIYLVHVIPLYVLCTTLTAGALLQRGGRWPRLVWGGAAAAALFTVASVAYRARLDVHHRAYLPTARYLQARVRPGDLVVAGGEFGIGLGYDRHVHDDAYLGYRRDRDPRFLVISDDYAQVQRASAAARPAFRRHLARVMARYRPVFRAEAGATRYRVYEHLPTAAAQAASSTSR